MSASATSRPGALRGLAPGWRALRIGVLGAASLLVAVGAHLIGGGSLPSPGVLVVAGIVLGLVALPLSLRQLRFGVLLAVLAVEQLALHEVLTAATAGTGCLPGAGSHQHALLVGCAVGQPAVVGGSETAIWSMTAVWSMWSMWLGHAAAVVATAWLLARGERWLWRVADRLSRAAAPNRTPLRLPAEPVAVAVGVLAVSASPSAPLPARGPPH